MDKQTKAKVSLALQVFTRSATNVPEKLATSSVCIDCAKNVKNSPQKMQTVPSDTMS